MQKSKIENLSISQLNAEIEKPIGRIALKQAEGEDIPIDVYTRAEAVETEEEAKTLQDKLTEYNAHAANLSIHSKAYVKNMVAFTIPATGWAIADEATDADFPYSLEVSVPEVQEAHTVTVSIGREDMDIASSCGLCPACQTLANTVKFWSRNIPTAAMKATLTVLGEGGLAVDPDADL